MKETSETSSLFERQARWREKNPLATWAHMATASALKRGLISKGPCVVCGTTEHVDLHHPDHSKPLETVSLCRLHHKEEHRRLKLEANQ